MRATKLAESPTAREVAAWQPPFPPRSRTATGSSPPRGPSLPWCSAAVITFTRDSHTAQFGLIVFGAFGVVDGLATGVGASFVPRGVTRILFVVQGAIGVLAGVLALALNSSGLGLFLYLVTVWAALTGVLELVQRVPQPQQGPGRPRLAHHRRHHGCARPHLRPDPVGCGARDRPAREPGPSSWVCSRGSAPRRSEPPRASRRPTGGRPAHDEAEQEGSERAQHSSAHPEGPLPPDGTARHLRRARRLRRAHRPHRHTAVPRSPA